MIHRHHPQGIPTRCLPPLHGAFVDDREPGKFMHPPTPLAAMGYQNHSTSFWPSHFYQIIHDQWCFFTTLQWLEFVHFWGWTVASQGIQSEVLDAQLPIAFYEANHGDHEPASPKGSWCGSSPLRSKKTSKKGDTAIQRQYWQNQICWHKVFEVISES